MLAISWIFWLKKLCLVFSTVLLKSFQSLIHLEILYFYRSLWQFSFHHALECFVILIIFEYLCYILSVLLAKVCIIFSRTSLLGIFSVLSLLMAPISSAMNLSSSLLFLTIIHFLVWIYSLVTMTNKLLTSCDTWAE